MACVICNDSNEVSKLNCCSGQVCDDCLKQHINTQLGDGNHIIKCPGVKCRKELRDVTMNRVMTDSMGEKQTLLKISAKKDPTVKLCPNCKLVTIQTKRELFRMKRSKASEQRSLINCRIHCRRCGRDWCFLCYAPWHLGVSCRDFNLNLKDQVTLWSKKHTTHNEQRNAYPCPYCGLYIERNGGCPSMRCSRCHTHWCYLCGKQKYLFVPLFGYHGDKYSVLGCTADWMLLNRDYEFSRKVRKGIFVTQIVLIVLISIPFLILTIPIWPAVLFVGATVLISMGIHKMLNKMKSSWYMEDY